MDRGRFTPAEELHSRVQEGKETVYGYSSSLVTPGLSSQPDTAAGREQTTSSHSCPTQAPHSSLRTDCSWPLSELGHGCMGPWAVPGLMFSLQRVISWGQGLSLGSVSMQCPAQRALGP